MMRLNDNGQNTRSPELLLTALRDLLDKLLSERGLTAQVLHSRRAKVQACDTATATVDLSVLREGGDETDERWPILQGIELPPFVQALGVGSVVRFGFAYGNRSGLYIQAIESAVDCVLQFGAEMHLGTNAASLGVPLGEDFVDALATQLALCTCPSGGGALVVPATMASALKAQCSAKVKVS